MRPELDAERGSGTVLTVGLVAVVVVLAGALALLAAAQSARAGARAGADLAALAAAEMLAAPRGVRFADPGHVGPASTGVAGDPCDRAREVAGRNGGTLARCTVLPDGAVQVTVTRPAGVATASATARAGPASLRDRTAADP